VFICLQNNYAITRYTTRKGLEIEGRVIACERGEHSLIPKHVRLARYSLKDRA